MGEDGWEMLTVTSAEADYVPLVEGQDKVLELSVQDNDGSFPDFLTGEWAVMGEESVVWFRITDPAGKPDSVNGQLPILYQVEKTMTGHGPTISFPTPSAPDNINVKVLVFGSPPIDGNWIVLGTENSKWFSSGGANFSRKAKPRLLTGELVIIKNGDNFSEAELTEWVNGDGLLNPYNPQPTTTYSGQHFLTTQIMIEFRQSPLAAIAPPA